MRKTERLLSRARAVKTQAGAVPSPCLSVCTMLPTSGLCHGCWRTLEEIGAWATMNDEDKRQVWQKIEARVSASKA